MKQEIKLTEALGKTLEGVGSSGNRQIVLVFTDGTFTTLGIGTGYEEGDIWICADSLDVEEFGDDELIRVGVSTQDELNNIRILLSEQRKQQHEARDKAEFDRLKKKFVA